MDVHPTKNGIHRYWPIPIWCHLPLLYTLKRKSLPGCGLRSAASGSAVPHLERWAPAESHRSQRTQWLGHTSSGLDAMPVSVKWIALHSLAQSRPNCDTAVNSGRASAMRPWFGSEIRNSGDFLAARPWSSPYLYIINYSTSGGSKCGGGRHLNFLGCTTLAAHEGHHADCQNS